MMLQENSFFSSPFVFYGENNNEQQIDDDDEECFSDLWSISLDTNKTIFPSPRIGLFIHWGDIND